MEPGGAGHDQPVRDVRREVRRPDVHLQAHDPGQRAARDHDVVERDERAPGRAAAGPVDRSAQRHPRLQPVRAGPDLLEQRLELVGLGLGQEADLAEVHADERDVDLGHGPGRAQERAVAAEHHEHLRPRQRADEARPGRPRRASRLSMPRTAHQPVARAESSTASSLVGL